MRPTAELTGEAETYLAVRGLGVAHMDAVLKGNEAAARFLTEDAGAALAAQGDSRFAELIAGSGQLARRATDSGTLGPRAAVVT